MSNATIEATLYFARIVVSEAGVTASPYISITPSAESSGSVSFFLPHFAKHEEKVEALKRVLAFAAGPVTRSDNPATDLVKNGKVETRWEGGAHIHGVSKHGVNFTVLATLAEADEAMAQEAARP